MRTGLRAGSSMKLSQLSRTMLILISWALLAPHLQAGTSKKKQPTSKEVIPQFPFIGVESGDGAMAMTCMGVPPYSTIQCNFLRLDISRKTPEDTRKSTQDGREVLVKMSDLELKAQAKRACESVKAAAGKGLPAHPGSGTRRAAEKGLETMKALCVPDQRVLGALAPGDDSG